MPNIGFAAQLRAARKTVGLSQAAAAKEIGTSLSTYKRWEQGDNVPLAITQSAALALLTTLADGTQTAHRKYTPYFVIGKSIKLLPLYPAKNHKGRTVFIAANGEAYEKAQPYLTEVQRHIYAEQLRARGMVGTDDEIYAAAIRMAEKEAERLVEEQGCRI